MRKLVFILLTILSLPVAIWGQSIMSQPTTSLYDASPQGGRTKEIVLKNYCTSFTFKDELYMLSYDSTIQVGRGESLSWKSITSEKIQTYSRDIYLFKRVGEKWVKWSGQYFRSVTNGFSSIEFGIPGEAFHLDNGWIVLSLKYHIETNGGPVLTYPLILLLCPLKNEDGSYDFSHATFTPDFAPGRRVKDVVKRAHKKYAILMTDGTSVSLDFFFKKTESGFLKLFEIQDDLGGFTHSEVSLFRGEVY